ncbi:hypothetical protein JAAARDRAFT_418001 [Jaapia argillacea MUCL 33604]|uniref:2-(3-amino-3-carboxypropyl)histidine synthase subunit 2 n=1 Tax=Jaapia argillacea MUCL 33604 TaxID=933084 RepID=A0A067PGP3_9AGAM|nr:hypothetical protein JAAARDRAFT_418001 [Jaapia argillacea MUCL 33604]
MSSTENTFSSPSTDPISRTPLTRTTLPLNATLSKAELSDYYEVQRTVDEIVQGGFKRVALQFPDELLPDSVPIYRLLKSGIDQRKPGVELYVLADTSYGSCCADEVAAQHVDSDVIVHYGHACLSRPYRLPVIYVFGKKPLDVRDCAAKLVSSVLENSEKLGGEGEGRLKGVVLRHDVGYTYKSESIVAEIRDRLSKSPETSDLKLFYSHIPTRLNPSVPTDEHPTSPSPSPASVSGPTESQGSDEGEKVGMEDCAILYVGEESMGLTNLCMMYSSSEIHTYTPSTRTTHLSSTSTNKLLMKRYAAVQKARDADVWGILVGTLGVASYLPLLTHIRNLLRKSHKKSYTISLGKLNPSKLANFAEVEAWVMVACEEGSLVDSKEFLKPIVTPFELEIALREKESWTGRYVLDFESVLSGQTEDDENEKEAESGEEGDDDERPMFSTVTGKYRKVKKFGLDNGADRIEEGDKDGRVVLRNQDNAVGLLGDSAGAEFLQSRTFQGLERREGEDAPSLLEQGRSGIARGYHEV